MKKTAVEWFDMLIEPYCTQAKENTTNRELRNLFPSLHSAIGCSFTWEETPQGQAYWDDIYELVRLNDSKYLKPLDANTPTSS